MTVRILSPADQRALDFALQHVALFGRDDQVAVHVRGPDRLKFLHNMLTQEVKALPPLAVRPAVLCDAQGAMIAATTLLLLPEHVVLWTDRALGRALVEALDKYVIMDDVELLLDEDDTLVGLVGPEVPALLQRLGVTLAEEGQATVVDVAGISAVSWAQTTGGRPGAPHGAGVPEVLLQIRRDDLSTLVPALLALGVKTGCHAAQEVLRIRAGRPRVGIDVDTGSLPLEAGLRAAISYRKGCYMGQEAIAMMTYRGQMRRHLCWVQPLGDNATLADAGWQLRTADGKRAGRMGSMAVSTDGSALGLAMVQRKTYAPGAELVATADDGSTGRIRVLATTEPDVFAGSEGVAPT